MNNPILDTLIQEYAPIKERYNKLYAVYRAINTKLVQVNQARSVHHKKIHAIIGNIPDGTLVKMIHGKHYYEVQSIATTYYSARLVHKHTGQYAPEEINGRTNYKATRPLDKGSVLPVDSQDPVFFKWSKHKLRIKLEGG